MENAKMVATKNNNLIVCGLNELWLDLDQQCVGSVRQSFTDVLNVGRLDRPYVGGAIVDDDYLLRSGDALEFVRERGSKGILEPDELDRLNRIEEALIKIESLLRVVTEQRVIKDWYATKEVAELLEKKEYTVREWCRLGRINCKKVAGGRGNEGEWRICHEELLRIQNQGLLPVPRRF